MASNRYGMLLSAAAALALALIVADFIVGQFNRAGQAQVSQRQQFINQSIEVNRINQTLVHALALAAVRNDDPQLKAVLAAQGITVNVAPTAARAPASVPSDASGASRKSHP